MIVIRSIWRSVAVMGGTMLPATVFVKARGDKGTAQPKVWLPAHSPAETDSGFGEGPLRRRRASP